jgi:hypothetical protein
MGELTKKLYTSEYDRILQKFGQWRFCIYHNLFIFIFGLFGNAAITSDYIALNDRMISEY